MIRLIVNIIETEHEKSLTNRELKSKCFFYARKTFQGKLFINIDTGRKILVSRDGLDEWYHKTKSRDQSVSIKSLDTLLENGKMIDRTNDKYERQYVKGFLYLSALCKINGTEYKAIISIKETKDNPDKFYHYYLQDMNLVEVRLIGNLSYYLV
jgi:hypothetical protein